MSSLSFGALRLAKEDKLFTSGLPIRITIDMATRAVENNRPSHDMSWAYSHTPKLAHTHTLNLYQYLTLPYHTLLDLPICSYSTYHCPTRPYITWLLNREPAIARFEFLLGTSCEQFSHPHIQPRPLTYFTLPYTSRPTQLWLLSIPLPYPSLHYLATQSCTSD